MRNQGSRKHHLRIGLALFTLSLSILMAMPQVANAQSIDLKELKVQKEAESIKKFTDSLTLFYNLVSAALAQNKNTSTGAGLKDKGEKVRSETTNTISNLEGLISKIKTANRFNDKFDADVNVLIGTNKIKGRLVRAGGARNFLSGGSSATAVNNLRKEIGTAASTLEFTKSEDLCRYLGIGILAEALLLKKATTANDKFYGQIGCDK